MSEPEIHLGGAITVTRRWTDWHACVTGNTAAWGCGSTVAEAIGQLIQVHPDLVTEAVLAQQSS